MVQYSDTVFPRIVSAETILFEYNLMYCDLWLQYIQVQKLCKGGNYSRATTIRGNTVIAFVLWCTFKALFFCMIALCTFDFFPSNFIWYLYQSLHAYSHWCTFSDTPRLFPNFQHKQQWYFVSKMVRTYYEKKISFIVKG